MDVFWNDPLINREKQDNVFMYCPRTYISKYHYTQSGFSSAVASSIIVGG